ncbi:MAG: CDP-diacylglycerol--glycerol-3-phosphate 3-phosphatidyltransferase [Deltaproteobacteria bacterium]|nr:CDP-diacylglycerol--glycerol-3-phosphate 3-phosphatidyltransferase [Deltaproteobacteria bacterium]
MTDSTNDKRTPEAKARLRREIFNIPNSITYARVAAIPLVLAFMAFDSQKNAFIAAMIFAVASASDALDGYLARRMNLISVLGKFLDPLADKLLVMGVLLMLIQLGRVSPWVALVILSREMIITGLRTVAASEGLVIAARELGKTKTAFQMVGLWALSVHYEYPIPGMGDPVDFHEVGAVFLYISVFFSVASALEYFRAFFQSVASPRP